MSSLESTSSVYFDNSEMDKLSLSRYELLKKVKHDCSINLENANNPQEIYSEFYAETAEEFIVKEGKNSFTINKSTTHVRLKIDRDTFINKFDNLSNFASTIFGENRKILWIVEVGGECTPLSAQLPAVPVQESAAETISHPHTFGEFKIKLEPIKTNEDKIKTQLKEWGVSEMNLAYASDIVTHFKENDVYKDDVWHNPFGGFGDNRNVSSDSLEELYSILFPTKEDTSSFQYHAAIADVMSAQPGAEKANQQVLINKKYKKLLEIKWSEFTRPQIEPFIANISTNGLQLTALDIDTITSDAIILTNTSITELPAKNISIETKNGDILFFVTKKDGTKMALSELTKPIVLAQLSFSSPKT